MRLPRCRLRQYPAIRTNLLLGVCISLWLLSFVGCRGISIPSTQPADFSFALSPATITIDAGGSNSTFTISATGQNGFASPISITLSGLPAGATTSPAFPVSLAVGSKQTIALSVPATVPVGNFILTVSATSGATTHVTQLSLKVNPQQDFSIAVSPTTITSVAGSSNTTFTVSTTPQNGFVSPVSITLSGLPAGATTFPVAPFSVAAGSNQTVTLSIPATVSTGNYTVTATGTSGALTHSAALTLTVTPLPVQDFSIAVSPSAITAEAGGPDSTFQLSITGQNGFSGSVTVAFSGLPAGAKTSPPSPFNVAANSSQPVALSVPSTASTGSYTVTATGTSGALTHSATLALTVTPAPVQDFSIAMSPAAITAETGGPDSTFQLSITGQNGFSGSVSITFSGLPAGAKTSPPSPFDVAANSSQPVALSVPSSASTGNYTVTATGTSGALTHSAELAVTVTGPTSVTTWHYNNARTSADTSEKLLTPSNVNSASFGKLATLPVDGFVVGHPLYLPGVNVPGQGVHNVVYVATMHDSVFAFDADNGNATPLWMISILTYSPPGATSVPATVTQETGIGWTEVGIISTPVIDPTTSTLYLVAETYENASVVHRLHALDVTTGQEKFGGPTTIVATYTLNGTTTTFTDLYQINRPGLLLANGHIYVGFGSNCCNAYSQGWLLSYNAATLQQEGAYTTEPGQTLASIWQKGAGVSADSTDNIYAETGEGPYTPGTNLSISVLKLGQTGTTLALTDWFTPYNQQYLSQNDRDLNDGVLILPDQPGTYPHELIAQGKEGTVYVLNRDNMGQFCSTCTSTTGGDTQIVQEIPLGAGHQSGTPVYWNNTVYFTGNASPVFAYTLNNGVLVTPPSVQSIQVGGGGHAIITANGNSNGVIWFINGGKKLWAMDATTLMTLYTSDQAANGRDTLPPLAHMATLIAANGKIFIGTQNSLVVYGPLH